MRGISSILKTVQSVGTKPNSEGFDPFFLHHEPGGTPITILIPALLGAVIGYITNRLAIQMLFRPLKPVVLFGKRLPFTPGLIPKERDRLAERIGATVHAYLLTEEAVLRHLESMQMLDRIRAGMARAAGRLRRSPRTVGETVERLTKRSPDELALQVVQWLEERKYFGWADPSIAARRAERILRYAVPHRDAWIDTTIDSAVRALIELAESDETVDRLQKRMEEWAQTRGDRTPEEILPEPVLLALLARWNAGEDAVAKQVKRLLQTERVREGLRAAVESAAEARLSGPLRLFVRPKVVAHQAEIAVADYLESEESTALVKEGLRTAVESLLSTPLSEWTQRLPQERAHALTKELLQGAALLLAQPEWRRALSEAVKKNDAWIEKAGRLLGEAAAKRLNQTEPAAIAQAVEPLFVRLFQTSWRDLLQDADDAFVDALAQKTQDILHSLLPILVHDAVSKFGADRLIEDQIRRFDAASIETIILDVADRELKAITWLGALLGAVMGLLQPVIHHFLP